MTGIERPVAECEPHRASRADGVTGHATPPPPPRLSVIIPCYNEESALGETSRRLAELLRGLAAAGKVSPESFVYFVDNGSHDATWDVIGELHLRDRIFKGVRLVRNVGVQKALLAGLMGVRAHADCVVSIDADLQQDERAIEAFLEKYRQGAHIVYGVRKDRTTDTLFRRSASTLFYKFMGVMGTKIVKDHSEYRLVSRQALDALADYREYNLFLRGVLLDTGFKSDVVYFDVRRRSAGKSKHNFGDLLSLALDAATSSSVVPLRFVTAAGMLIFAWSCLMILFVLYQRLWTGNAIPGWAATLIPIYVLGGAQIMFLGVIGEYIGRIYREVKARPRYVKEAELF